MNNDKRKCLMCDNHFDIPTAPSRMFRKKYCSRVCANKGNGKFTSSKRGDVQRGRGLGKTYTKLNGKNMHRAVMENFLNRKLTFNEVVHHIDGNIKNNIITNLMVMSRSEHSRHHSTKIQ